MTAQSADTQKTVMQSAPISLAEVRRLFTHTDRVQASQFLRREISARMFERLSLIKTNPKTLCDAGCGEGDDLLVLRSRFPQPNRGSSGSAHASSWPILTCRACH
jgi:hypothetical protein